MSSHNNPHYSTVVHRHPFSRLFISGLILGGLLTGCGGGSERDTINYVSDLGSDDPLIQMAAAKALSTEATEIDVVAVPYLIISLQDPRELIRRYSAQALGHIRDYSSIPALIKNAGRDSDYVRYDCIVSLNGFDDPRVKAALITGLKDKSSYVRWASADGLGELRVMEAYPQLISGLKDTSSHVRSASAKALGLLGDKAAIPHLRNSIYNPNLWVRNAAALALARLGDTEGIPILILHLSSEARDKKGTVREQAVDFLREISGKNFGYDPSVPPEKRKEAIARWEKWWEKQQAGRMIGR